jgi:hypothetical protein
MWLTILLAAFFIIQKPVWGSVVVGLSHFISTILIWLLLIVTSLGIGYFVLNQFSVSFRSVLKIIYSTGFGLGVLGLLGFLLTVMGITNKWLLLAILLIFFLFSLSQYRFKLISQDIQVLCQALIRSKKYAPTWIFVFSTILFSLSFLLSLAPPIEAFDGLFYHLTVPLGGFMMADWH